MIEENSDSSSPATDDIVFDVTRDIASLNQFFSNLKVGALELQHGCTLELRTRVALCATHPQKKETVKFEGELVSIQSGRAAFHILNLTSELQQKLQALLSSPTQVPKEAPSASTTNPTDNEWKSPTAGKLNFHLPTFLRHIFDEANNQDWKSRSSFLKGTLPGLVLEISRHQGSGRLTCKAGEITTHIYFNDGQIVGVEKDPTRETDTVAYLMRKAGKLTETQYRALRKEQSTSQKSDGLLLAPHGNKRDLARIMRQDMYRNLGQAFAFPEVQFTFTQDKNFLLEILLLPISIRRALFRGIIGAAATYPTDELRHGLDPYMTHFVILRETLPFEPSTLKLNQKELRFLEVTLAKPTRLRRLFAISALSRIQSLRAIYAFYMMGFIDFSTNYQPEEKDLLPHLEQTIEEFRTIDLFEILHIHWAALPDEITRSYEQIVSEWKNLSIPEKSSVSCKPLQQKILKTIEDAYATLSSCEDRRHYRKDIIGPHQRKFSAELLSQHARTEMFRKEHKRARQHIEQALDLAPSNPEYREILRQIKKDS